MSQYFLSLLFIFFSSFSYANADKETEATILIVRGLTRENAHNQSFMDIVNKTKPHWQVLSFDIPGNGSLYNETSFTSIQENTDFIRSQWQKRVSSKRKFVLGISLGGMMVLDWMKRYPQDFETFLVANSSQSNFCSVWERVLPSSLGYLLTVALPFSSETKELAIRDMTINIKNNDKQFVKSWVEIRNKRPVSLLNVLRQMWAGSQFDFSPEGLQPSLKVIVSKNDRMVSSECSVRLANYFKAPLSIHATAGHDITNDAPEWIIGQLEAAIKPSL